MMSNITAARAAATYFDKIDRYELQESLAYYSSDWLLSTEDTLPSICLEANYDCSTSCQIPPAYYDTRVGQLLTEVDYMMKSLWHGAYFPKDKRTKFAERWRQAVNLNTTTGEPETRRSLHLVWTEAGIQDLAKDPEFMAAYETLPPENKDDPFAMEEKKTFMRHVDDLALKLTLFQKQIHQHQNIFLVDADYHISSIVKSDKLEFPIYEKLQRRITSHQEFIRKFLPLKAELHRHLVLLKFVSFMVPFLIAIKKRCKVPDVSKLLPPFTFEECKTEREFPPLILRPDFTCKNFESSEKYFHLHGGIVFDRETGSTVPLSDSIIAEKENLEYVASDGYSKASTDSVMLESYPMKLVEINGKSYYVLNIVLETYYPASPKLPLWVHAHYDEIAKLKPKRLPIPELQIHEQFKKRYGYQKTVKLKQIPAGLHAAAVRGLVAIFYTMCRRLPPSRLTTQDSTGLSLIHYAAMYNRPQIITMLMVMGFDINVRRFNNISSQGVTPLHLAARCGALESLACLISYKADVSSIDSHGWSPVHYAAYFNHVDCLLHLIHKDTKLVQLQSKDETLSTPILLSASSGALDAVKCLIELNADYTVTNNHDNGMIQLASLHFHTNILEYFIEWNNKDLPVWDILVGMLKSEHLERQKSAVKCLEVLSVAKDNHWKSILYAGGVPALVTLLKTDDEDLQGCAASVLCNIGSHEEVRLEVSAADAVVVVIKLLNSPVAMIHSRSAVIIGDLGCVSNNQEKIAEEGGIEALVGLLNSDVEHVLVNAVNALRVVADGSKSNQKAIAESGALDILISLLSTRSKKLQANTAACLSSLAKCHHDNQDLIVAKGAVKSLVTLARSKSSVCQVKAASALEALAEKNPEAQKIIDEADAPKPLIRLLKMWSIEVKEQGAGALWALAGSVRSHQQRIASMIGINILVDMLMLKSERLQYIAGSAMIALATENIENQNKIVAGGGVLPLVRLLRAGKSSQKVLLMVIRVLGILCVGVAHQSNKSTQVEIANAEALVTLVQLLRSSKVPLIQVETAITIGKIALNNNQTQKVLAEQTRFRVIDILHLLKDEEEEVRLKAGRALSIFGYNNTSQQYAIKNAGGVKLASFEEFLESSTQLYRAHAAFQIIVLARVIVDCDQVTLTARGVQLLVSLLASDEDHTKILAASLTASLGHTRAGIPAALITAGAVKALLQNLFNANEEVRSSAAVALGYLSFDRTAERLMLVACRNTPGLFDALLRNLGSGKIAMVFVDDWNQTKNVGLPSER
ncbi:predicted protein [Nematostella vectensis]|uniref:Ankyrin and armadillo repeat-containing protein n=1 Tax=Nematostella vectensis TaxID=45351 RepID=A7RY53_NEMVE|nr:predicted protein [Nematostella vectensis]|eukprot:XP_001635640.1 predicted protein [Nematostella vectensis]